MTRGGSAEADITVWNGSSWDPTGDTVTVKDANEKIPAGVTLDSGNSITAYQDKSGKNLGVDSEGSVREVANVLLSFDCDETS
jgi:hypothetical protein